MEIHVELPSVYVDIARNARQKKETWKRYAHGYIEKNHPELEIIKLKGKTAICQKKQIRL